MRRIELFNLCGLPPFIVVRSDEKSCVVGLLVSLKVEFAASPGSFPVDGKSLHLIELADVADAQQVQAMLDKTFDQVAMDSFDPVAAI